MPNTAHRDAILFVLASIPGGRVATYGQIARLAGQPGGARYVGHLLSALSGKSVLPWHRVINAAGRISLPKESDAYLRQKALLSSEGIQFIGEKISLRVFQWRI